MLYLIIRHIHLTCVLLTVTLFVLRGALGLMGLDWRVRWPVLRWLPHVNDTLLLSAGLTLMVMSGQYPGPAHPWLAGKLLLLLAYIGAGKQALRPGLTRAAALGWLVVALGCVGGIVALAMTRWGG